LKSASKKENQDILHVDYQSASLDIWDKKYRLKDISGKFIDLNIEDTFKRVAKALVGVEHPDIQDKWEKEFFWALSSGAIPAGRIMSNAGAGEHKPATSTINCTVSGSIPDSMTGILEKVTEAGLTLKAGCGIGYEFSTLRPKGAYVTGAGAYTSGPLSFMDIYDKTCFTVSSAGGRRGAQMGTFDIGHPDVEEFIKAKRENGRLRQFNLSLLITEEFIKAVKEDNDWPLAFPLDPNLPEAKVINLEDPKQIIWREWTTTEGYITNDNDLVACKVYKIIRARELWDLIMDSTYNYAEPGFILIDKVNEMNNNWFDENIRATNPCGEQPLPEYGSCLLGSVNLTRFVQNPFTDEVTFNWKSFRRVVGVFTRMLDNVVEINGLPIERQREEICRKRRHGMGFLGLGSAMTMMQMKYGSQESLEFTDQVSKELAVTGWKIALELSKEKGPAPIFFEEFSDATGRTLAIPDLAYAGPYDISTVFFFIVSINLLVLFCFAVSRFCLACSSFLRCSRYPLVRPSIFPSRSIKTSFFFFFLGSIPGSPCGPTPIPCTFPPPAQLAGASSSIPENGDTSFQFFILYPLNLHI